MMKHVGVFLALVFAMQTVSESKLFSQSGGLRLCGEECIRSAFDNELTLIKFHTIGSDLAAPAIRRFDQGYLCIGKFLLCIISSSETRDAATDNYNPVHTQLASIAVLRINSANPSIICGAVCTISMRSKRTPRERASF